MGFEGFDSIGGNRPPDSYNGATGDVDEVVSIIDAERGASNVASEDHGPKLARLTTGEEAYAAWLRNKSPEGMSRVLDAFAPTINSEITRYSGPKNLLRSKAKVLAIRAVKTFNPMSGARLNSWIVTNLKQLSRYSIKQRDVHVSEDKARLAAEVDRVTRMLKDDLGRDPTDDEISDEIGISPKRVRDARSAAVASVASSYMSPEESGDDDSSSEPGVVTPSKVPFAQEAVYHDLTEADRFVFDALTGSHGVNRLSGAEVARRLGVSPAAVSQKASAIARKIEYVVNNA